MQISPVYTFTRLYSKHKAINGKIGENEDKKPCYTIKPLIQAKCFQLLPQEKT